jgi:PKHD-type hydroxylase
MRADVEVTCFLTDPESYSGGELLIDTGFGDVTHKEAIGSCVVCPAASKRRLNPITGGESYIARIDVQSFVRDVQQRMILYDLITAADFFDLAGMTAPVLTLRRCCDRLLGLWAEV